jgi:hypothetical protein
MNRRPLAMRCLALAAILPATGAAHAADLPQGFDQTVKPLLSRHCLGCHSAEKKKGDLDLEQFKTLQDVLARPKVWHRVLEQISAREMPPPDKPQPDPAARAQFESWLIEALPRSTAAKPSAADQRSHWAFQPLRVPVPREKLNSRTARSPKATEAQRPSAVSPDGDSQITSPADTFVRAKSPAPPADKRTLLRRATFDLIGLPPAPEDVDAFLADQSPDAFTKVIERLLASPHYGEHWGRKWLDVVRYADTAGENSDHPLPHAWRYRNWVINAFNDDKPYDEFIREQIAGDLLAADGPEDKFADRIIATGYLAIARRFGHDIDKDMHLTFEDTIDTLGKSVLGLTLGCARCHDHKNDPVTMRDYYGLYGIFESTRFAFPGCEPQQQPRDLVPLWNAREIAAKRRPFDDQLAALDAAIKKLTDAQAGAQKALRKAATNSVTLLAKGEFNDGGAQPFTTDRHSLPVPVKAGELVQLTILPRANYGADTTVIEFEIEETGGDRRRWNLTADVTGDFLAGNPHADAYGHAATWCFLDPRKGLQLLPEAVRDHEGRKGLHIWRNGDNPAAFVNATDQPIKVWTTLPARTFFVHPAPDGPVAVAWLSPVSGTVKLTGRVADGHPGGGDGVAWRLEQLAADFGPGMKELASLAKELREPLKQRAEPKAREPKVPVAYAVAEGKVRNAKLQKRGDPEQPGTEVPRKFLDLLGGQPVAATNLSGRLELARWLTSPTNPLTARVMVNRIWLGHFGQGLVATPNDFGRQGRPPTHPGLLDWLAAEFIKSGWSMKAMHRRVMLSAAYQRSSVVSEPANSKSVSGSLARTSSPMPDPMPAGFPRRRLTAEELRDTLLAVTGELDRTPGGAHPFPPEEKWNYTQHGPFADSYDTLKRSVYVMQKRNRRIPFFALFDGADPNASTAKRDLTTVPTQALYFMNDPFVHARAEKFSLRILKSGEDDRARLDFTYRQLFGRTASPEEQADAAGFLRDYAAGCADQPAAKRGELAWSAYARVLFSSNEMLFLD